MNEWQMTQKEETEIDLLRIGRAVAKWAWAIVIVALIFGMVSYIYSAYFIDPQYRSGFTAYVNNRIGENVGNVTLTDLNSSIGLAYAYGEIILSRSVLQGAAQQCGYQIPYSELKEKVTVTVSDTTAIIQVYVKDTDPVRATALASAIADTAPYHVERVVDGSSMRILDEPVQPNSHFEPSNSKNAALGALIGFVLAVAAVVIAELVNDKVQDVQELENRYQVAVIGSIPDLHSAQKSNSQYGYRRVVK